MKAGSYVGRYDELGGRESKKVRFLFQGIIIEF
jgi:hypothetical protein